MQYSTEQAAKIVQTISFVLAIFHKSLPVEEQSLAAVIGGIIFVGATLYGWFRRWKRGDIKFSGIRITGR